MNTLRSTLEEIFKNSNDMRFGFTTALSLTQALWALGGALGSQIGGILGSKIGRKNTLLCNNIFLVVGCLLQFFTFQFRTWSYIWIMIGRFINGIGCGVQATVSPTYLMETAPEHLKGAFGCSFSILWVLHSWTDMINMNYIMYKIWSKISPTWFFEKFSINNLYDL